MTTVIDPDDPCPTLSVEGAGDDAIGPCVVLRGARSEVAKLGKHIYSDVRLLVRAPRKTTEGPTDEMDDLLERVAEAADVQGVGFYVKPGNDELDRCRWCSARCTHEEGEEYCPTDCDANEPQALDVELDRIVAERRAGEDAAAGETRLAADKHLRKRMRGKRP